MPTTLLQSDLAGLNLIHRGKVRDVYALSERELLIVATDRLSAFDVVLPDPIPGKGEMLCQISNFWFGKTAHLLRNHLTGMPVSQVLPKGVDADLYTMRSVVAKRLKAVPIEAIARGYLIGSGLEGLPGQRHALRHQAAGRPAPGGKTARAAVHAIHQGRRRSARREHRFRPRGRNDRRRSGRTGARRDAEDLCIRASYAAERGILVADTKFEFGTDETGKLYVMDEMLTPDSSRFWPADQYRVGISPPSYDKQFVRDYLETLDWGQDRTGTTSTSFCNRRNGG